MGGSSGGGNSTVRNINEIDPVTQAWRASIFGQGGQLYNQGIPDYYPGSTVVPFSNQTQSGLDYLQGQAQQGAPNLAAAQQAAGRALSGNNPAMPFAMDVAQGGLSNNPAMGALGQFGSADNPHLRGLFDQGAEMVGNAVGTQFAQAGRFGPGNAAHTGALTRGLGDLYTSIYAPAYEAERNRGLTAAQTIGSLYDTGANRQLGGAQLAGLLHAQGNEDAARASVLLPGLFSYGQLPGQQMLDIGGIYENQAGQYLADDRARYDYAANAPWDYLQRYAGLMSGLPDFSNQTQNTTGPGPNRTMTALGGAMAGAQLGSQIYPGWGTAIGAVAGGLFGGYGG